MSASASARARENEPNPQTAKLFFFRNSVSKKTKKKNCPDVI